MDATFSALADPIRRAIIARLSHGEASVGELARPFKVSLPAISRHLRVLESAGLLAQERQGRVRRCRLRPKPMTAAAEWLRQHEQFWSNRLDALAGHFEKD
jgi:DNA-binding transcriptional ArsR family regulator